MKDAIINSELPTNNKVKMENMCLDVLFLFLSIISNT